MAETDSFAARRRGGAGRRRDVAVDGRRATAVFAVRRGGVQADEGSFADELPLDLGYRCEDDEEDLARAVRVVGAGEGPVRISRRWPRSAGSCALVMSSTMWRPRRSSMVTVRVSAGRRSARAALYSGRIFSRVPAFST
uniref:hypothetical protein n=1 Tax=Streptomyces sp. SID7805 TaxID=2690328 RepID=UPI001F04BD87|nr:hypothetical protein [Streptomyces sp. SID7805]